MSNIIWQILGISGLLAGTWLCNNITWQTQRVSGLLAIVLGLYSRRHNLDRDLAFPAHCCANNSDPEKYYALD